MLRVVVVYAYDTSSCDGFSVVFWLVDPQRTVAGLIPVLLLWSCVTRQNYIVFFILFVQYNYLKTTIPTIYSTKYISFFRLLVFFFYFQGIKMRNENLDLAAGRDFVLHSKGAEFVSLMLCFALKLLSGSILWVKCLPRSSWHMFWQQSVTQTGFLQPYSRPQLFFPCFFKLLWS